MLFMIKRAECEILHITVQYFFIFAFNIHETDKMEEQKLSILCEKGDRNARKILYENYAGYMLGICVRYVGDRNIAQDLLHDGFLKIFASFDKFTWRGNGSLKAWMSRIMVNTVIEYLRKRNNGITVYDDGYGILSGNGSGKEEELGLYAEPQVDKVSLIPEAVIMRFISELPGGYRTVFNLFVFEGKSHREIASVLGINEKSSSSQLLRAKNALAKKINEYIKDNEL